MTIPTTHAQAEALMRRDCEIEIRLKQIETDMQDQITQARKLAAIAKAPLVREQSRIETALKNWFHAVRRASEQPMCAAGTLFGRVASYWTRKKGVCYLDGWDNESVMEALLRKPTLADFIRVKHELKKDEVREAIEHGPEELAARLADCGLALDPGKEQIFVELDLQALREEVVQ